MPIRQNKHLASMRSGKPSSICQMYFASDIFVELLGLAEVDVVMFDGEHGVFSPGELDSMCRVAEAHGMSTIARVPDIEYGTIQTYLDRGVQGILGPDIQNKADAQQLVNACRYPPRGRRGTGGAPRAIGYADIGTADMLNRLNSEIFVCAFLESVEAEKNLEEILAVPGIDGYYVGPADYSLSIGVTGQLTHPKVKAFSDRVQKAAESRGKIYFGENLITVERATSLVLDGAKAMVARNKSRLE